MQPLHDEITSPPAAPRLRLPLFSQVHGPDAVDVHVLLEALRGQGELYPIGAQVALLEERDRRRAAPPQAQQAQQAQHGPHAGGLLPQAKGEVHAAVARAHASASDARKFHLHSGTAALALRAETM